ncbi:MAG: Omp28 family outer membrane lipoprotein [Bacteroidia bacterium]|nr:Omp28 family outer membrane lipoprotein [Bacteroidia bacterium]
MKAFRIYAFLLMILFVAGACDIIESPYLDEVTALSADAQCVADAGEIEPFGEGTIIAKKVLLEEMTGHKCGNCPEASAKVHQLIEAQQGKVVLVTIHAGSLSTFTAGASKYSTNFTTPSGTEIYSAMNNTSAVPFGMVDRVNMNNNFNTWGTYVEERLQETPEAGLRIFNCYDSDSLKLTTVVDIKYLTDAPSDDHLSVFLIEDGIVDWQKDYKATGSSPDLPDYVHHNVLRSAINGTWGQPVSETAISNEDRFTLSYSFTLLPEYNASKCSIVAFIHNRTTREVRQVEIAPLVP